MNSIESKVRASAALLSASPTPLLDARVLVGFALGLDDAAMIMAARRVLSAEECERIDKLVARRITREPIAYIVGRKEFWSLDFEVRPPVLIPRADSETLIESICARRRQHEVRTILDLGCGSGALLAALLTEFPLAWGIGVDANPAAAALTSRNLARLGLAARGRAQEGNWGQGLAGPFDIIVSNPPYIRDGDRNSLPRDVRDYEDPGALFAGPDGLDAHRAILSTCLPLLDAGGLLALEMGAEQAADLADLASSAAPEALIETAPDLGGRPRVLTLDRRGKNNR